MKEKGTKNISLKHITVISYQHGYNKNRMLYNAQGDNILKEMVYLCYCFLMTLFLKHKKPVIVAIFNKPIINLKQSFAPRSMKFNVTTAIYFILLLLLTSNTYAQQRSADSTIYQASINNATTSFKKNIDLQSGLYNGQEYVFYNRQKNDNPFFQDQFSWNPSTLSYNGATFTDVPLIYDVLRDQVVALLYNKVANYILVSEKITDFTLMDHHFVYRNIDSIASNGLKSGIYDQIYNGKSEVLVKRKKNLYLTTVGQKSTYPIDDKQFIKKEEKYFEASGKNGVLGVFKDKKKELRKYINDNNIDFKNREAATIAVVSYYDKLTQ